ncbi:MAG: nucleotidyltransferase domain-containing protein [Cytophagales bacterium]|nr:MAG: nucleotidyltransferase domain-containing protein [Cytophagales bacterium]
MGGGSKIVQGVSEISLNRLKNRFLGLKDRTTGEIRVKVFGSRTKGTHRPESDLDICILAEDISVFKTDRCAKIVKTILEDFFIETGIKVDLTIITPHDMPYMKFSWSDLKDF